MTSATLPHDPRVGHLMATLRGRSRISFSLLAHHLSISERGLRALLKGPLVAKWLAKHRWRETTSRALALPPLERWPYVVTFLIRS
jgi:hypothetical protein